LRELSRSHIVPLEKKCDVKKPRKISGQSWALSVKVRWGQALWPLGGGTQLIISFDQLAMFSALSDFFVSDMRSIRQRRQYWWKGGCIR